MNRIAVAIERRKFTTAQRIVAGLTTIEAVDKLHKTLDMAIDEYCLLQERKSLAFASGKLTLEEANTIYGYLGESVETYNNQPIEVKSVLTQVFAELLK